MRQIIIALKKWWLLVPIALCPVIGALSLWGGIRDIDRPYPGFMISRSIYTARYYPERSDPIWQFTNMGIYSRAILVFVEGQPFGPNYIQAFERALGNGKQSVQVTICRTSSCLQNIAQAGETLTLPIRAYTWSDYFQNKLPMALCGLIFFLLSIVAFRFGRSWMYYHLLILGFAMATQFCWGVSPTLFLDENLLGRILDAWSWTVLLPMGGAVIIHFALLYPTPSRVFSRPLLIAIYGLATANMVIYGIARLAWWHDPLATWYQLLDRLGNEGSIWYVALGSVFLIVRLTVSFFGKHRPRWIGQLVFPLMVTVPFVALFLLVELARVSGPPGFSNTSIFVWGIFDQRYLLLPVLVAFTYNLLRYEFDPLSPLLLKAILALASAMVLAEFLKVLVIAGQKLLVPALSFQTVVFLAGFVILAIALVIAFLFQASTQNFLGRRSFVAIRQFGQKIAGCAQPLALNEAIVRACLDEMEVSGAALWLLKADQSQPQSMQLRAYAGEVGAQLRSWLPLEPLSQLKHSLRFDPVSAQPFWPGKAIDIMTPLIVTGNLIGLLGLGKRLDAKVFDYTDLEVIEQTAQEAASLLNNALTLQQIPALVAEAQERERRKIAQELHDTTQQFLARLQFYLEISLKSLYKAPNRSAAQLRELILETSQAAQTLREIRTNIAPAFLEIGLKQPLLELVQQFERHIHVQADLQLSDELDTGLPIDSRLVLYRIVQQALDNVAAHALASQVSVKIVTDQQRVFVEIKDNGRGFSPDQRWQAQAGGSFGLVSMESRAQMMGGELHILGSPGSGTQVSGWLPLAN